ncbi:MAG: serine hydrolase [Flavobacteriales bacterium]|nr:serine hydrolase [Flavobacteriales bacterium]
MRIPLLLAVLFFGAGAQAQQLYFPAPQANSAWETVDPSALGWCTDQEQALHDFLASSNTKAFIVLKDGRIALEWYFGTFTTDSAWYWASAGKSLTAFLVGRAQQEGSLDINAPASTYLGAGWTSLTPAQEEAITVRHQLTMTSGLDDSGDLDCTDPACLTYLAEPGTRWSYHNAPYTLLHSVLESATGLGSFTFLFTRLTVPTGINGLFLPVDDNIVFFSGARSMARFGLLMQGGGAWDGNPILSDVAYYDAMITPSQSLNEAYGYLWWLNGQESFMLPGLQFVFNGPAMTNAPMDVYAALGKNGQIINVSPSTGLVVVRMGNLPGDIFVPNLYNDQIWQHLNALMCTGTNVEVTPGATPRFAPNPAFDLVRVLDTEVDILEAWAIGTDGRRHALPHDRDAIQVDGLAPGLYQIGLRCTDGMRLSGRLVVER